MTILDALDGLTPPRTPRFDLAGAEQLFTDAATRSAVANIMSIALGGIDLESLEEARTRMQCAGGVLAWEMARNTRLGLIPGAPWLPAMGSADYDEETIEHLLRGARG
ncbi:hypothetical protein [Mycolicibacterium porcinum]|uniref:Uncharacterized protein n=1 Tax=Mycolicibacterium porcinum TaxID=39693 RepID=A0ABV3VI49_9MYCO